MTMSLKAASCSEKSAKDATMKTIPSRTLPVPAAAERRMLSPHCSSGDRHQRPIDVGMAGRLRTARVEVGGELAMNVCDAG